MKVRLEIAMTHLCALLGVAPVGELPPVDVAHGAPSLGGARGLARVPIFQAAAVGGRQEQGEEKPEDERIHFLTVGGAQTSI